MPEGREPGRKGWLQVTPAVGTSGGQPAGDRSRGHNRPAGLAARFALGEGIGPHLAQCCHPAGKERGEGWRGQPVLPVANIRPFLPDISVCVCVCLRAESWSLYLHPPLSPCQRAAGRALAGMLLGFLEGSVPLGGTKKLR